MIDKPNIVLCTGSSSRHRHYAWCLLKMLNLSGIVVEQKSSPVTPGKQTEVVKQHLRDFKLREEEYFGHDSKWDDMPVPLLRIVANKVNQDETYSWVLKMKPDVILLYGTSIIKEPLLSLCKLKIINLHLGLSPYYRGTATNVWPLVNNEPECVGATFHIATSSVDHGPILHQIRPELSSGDDVHDIGLKTVQSAGIAAPMVVAKYFDRQINIREQSLAGHLYRKSDFSEKILLQMKKNFAQGMLGQYLQNKELRDKGYPIITYN